MHNERTKGQITIRCKRMTRLLSALHSPLRSAAFVVASRTALAAACLRLLLSPHSFRCSCPLVKLNSVFSEAEREECEANHSRWLDSLPTVTAHRCKRPYCSGGSSTPAPAHNNTGSADRTLGDPTNATSASCARALDAAVAAVSLLPSHTRLMRLHPTQQSHQQPPRQQQQHRERQQGKDQQNRGISSRCWSSCLCSLSPRNSLHRCCRCSLLISADRRCSCYPSLSVRCIADSSPRLLSVTERFAGPQLNHRMPRSSPHPTRPQQCGAGIDE